jgi:hypothetical protein
MSKGLVQSSYHGSIEKRSTLGSQKAPKFGSVARSRASRVRSRANLDRRVKAVSCRKLLIRLGHYDVVCRALR